MSVKDLNSFLLILITNLQTGEWRLYIARNDAKLGCMACFWKGLTLTIGKKKTIFPSPPPQKKNSEWAKLLESKYFNLRTIITSDFNPMSDSTLLKSTWQAPDKSQEWLGKIKSWVSKMKGWASTPTSYSVKRLPRVIRENWRVKVTAKMNCFPCNSFTKRISLYLKQGVCIKRK